LESLGYVRRDGRYFELTPRVLELSQAFQSSNQYHTVIQHYLRDITEEIGESSSLSVLDGIEVVYVVRSAAPHRLMAITLSAGTRLPAAYTSMGRVLLAQLSDSELDGMAECYAVGSAAPHRLMAITLSARTRLPAAYTSSGRVLRAQLSDSELEARLLQIEPQAHTPQSLTTREELRKAILQARH